MRHNQTHAKQQQSPPNKNGGFGSLATKAFVATATASASYAAYAFLFSPVAVVNGDNSAVADVDSTGEKKGGGPPLFKEEKKSEEKKRHDKYGIESVSFDSYPGVHLDDGTGVATKEFKAASAEVVSRALDAAGLGETGITKGIAGVGAGVGDDITLHPKHAHRVGLGTCPVYGCPFLPMDVHYNVDVKAQLESMRKLTSPKEEEPTSGEGDDEDDDESGSDGVVVEGEGGGGGGEHLLKSSGSENAATLTLIGYKGGKFEDQINQDRALALSPFMYWNINGGGEAAAASAAGRPVARLIGAFDGHAKHGEKVSEYVVRTLPALLGSKLVEYESRSGGSEEEGEGGDDEEGEDRRQQQKDRDIGKILHDTFLELDATSPAKPSGGCTATMVLQIGTKLYVANAGDSRSFIVVHVKSPPSSSQSSGSGDKTESQSTTTIVYGTREDKPHLTTERDRVEHMGGTVYLPNGFVATGKGTTRVLYADPVTGSTSGLAMSRSIGDWDAGEVGVVPDPVIDILDIKDIKARVLEKLREECKENAQEVEVDPATGESSPSKTCVAYTEKDVKIFAVSGSDGLLDYLPEQSIADHVAEGLYEAADAEKGDSDGKQQVSHPLLVCEDLIYSAAHGWQKDKGGRYRDDIAIAVTDLELE